MQNPNGTWGGPIPPHEQVSASNINLILHATWQRLWDICGESSDSLLKAVIAASEDENRRVLAAALDSNMGLKVRSRASQGSAMGCIGLRSYFRKISMRGGYLFVIMTGSAGGALTHMLCG